MKSMKTRDDIMEVLRKRFSPAEAELLMSVPMDGDNIARLAEREGIGEEAIKARYRKLVRKLRRHLRKGEFEVYKKAVCLGMDS